MTCGNKLPLDSHARGHWFKSSIAHHRKGKSTVFSWGYAEVAEWQTRCVQGAVSLADVGVQISPSAPLNEMDS